MTTTGNKDVAESTVGSDDATESTTPSLPAKSPYVPVATARVAVTKKPHDGPSSSSNVEHTPLGPYVTKVPPPPREEGQRIPTDMEREEPQPEDRPLTLGCGRRELLCHLIPKVHRGI